jgi:competence protein ComEC
MRVLAPWLATCFAGGLLLGDHWPALARPALIGAVIACVLAGLLRLRPSAAFASASCAAVAAGVVLLGARVERTLPQLTRAPRGAIVEGRVARVEPLLGRTRIELAEVEWVTPREPGAARVELWSDAGVAPPLGATIRVALRTRALIPGAANPGGRNALRSLARRGVGASGQLIDPLLLEVVESSSRNPLQSLANRRLAAVDRLRHHGRGGALLAALALGDAEGLPERDRRAWAALGIAHLLSVSGLHLAIAAAMLFAGCAACLRRSAAIAVRRDTRRLALGPAVLAAALYALVAGLATPALRSLLMLAAVGIALARRRAARPAHALALAALLVLAFDPAALFAPGAQLSFAATAALVLGRVSDAERRSGVLQRALASMLSTTARASLGTAPIAALHFGAAPPFAGIANLIAIPLTAFVAMPLAFAAAACAWTAPTRADAALRLAARAAEAGLDAALALADGAPRVAPSPPAALALVVSAALCALGVSTRRLLLRVACALAAQLALAFFPPPALAPAPPRIVFLDVGHGDAALVQARDLALLVDAGAASPDGWDAGARVVVPALAALGVRRLDALVLTHADLDHRGGASAVLAAFPCGELWLPRGAARERAFAAVVADARSRGVGVREIGAGDSGLVGADLRVTPLWPPPRAEDLSDNDRSLVLRVEIAGLRALLLGDLEARGEAALLAGGAALRADVLKLGHHGSRSSSTTQLLAAVRPRLAIASAPRYGRFGWPHALVRERVAAAGAALGWTGRDGALVVAAGPAPCLRAWRRGDECAPLSARGLGVALAPRAEAR